MHPSLLWDGGRAWAVGVGTNAVLLSVLTESNEEGDERAETPTDGPDD